MGKRTPEQSREYRLRTLEKALERDRKYRLKNRVGNPEYLADARVRNKEYYKQNKEELAMKRRMNAAIKRQGEVSATEPNQIPSGWVISLKNITVLRA